MSETMVFRMISHVVFRGEFRDAVGGEGEGRGRLVGREFFRFSVEGSSGG